MPENADLTRIQALHQQARRGELNGAGLDLYGAVMREYMEGLVAHHNRSLSERQTARRHPRIPRSVQVEVSAADRSYRTLTLDCGLGGFAALLPSPAERGSLYTARLKLGAQELVTAPVRVTDSRRVRGSARVSFAFVGVADRDLERLEMFIRDAALSRSYWVLAPCTVPIQAPVPAAPAASSAGPANEAEECSFVLVFPPDARAVAAPLPSRADRGRRVACTGGSGSGASSRLSWW